MTIIRASSIQCVADEASATRYQYADDLTVLAYSQKEADATVKEWVASQKQAKLQDDNELTLPL